MHGRAVHLADFGLARAVGTGQPGLSPTRLTRTGEAIGTPAYMSPEQAAGAIAPLSPASDVWALGCLAYELLAGRPPFAGESPAAIVGAVLGGRAPALRRSRRDLPSDLHALVDAALEAAPARRPRDARALARELGAILDGRSTGRAVRVLRRRLAVVAGVAVLAIGTIGVALAIGGRGGLPAPPESPAATARVLAEEAARRRVAEPAAAAELYARAAVLDPTGHGWRVERGLLLWSLGRHEEARAEWGRVPADSGARPWAALYLGLEQLFALHVVPRARSLDEAAASPGPAGTIARAAIAAAEERWGDATTLLKGVDGWEASILRGYVAGQSIPEDRGSLALAELDRGITETTAAGLHFAWAFTLRGMFRRLAGRPAEALADLERAAGIAPDLPGLQGERAIARSLVGDVPGALAALDARLQARPDDVDTWRARAAVCAHAQDLAGALAAGERVLALEPGRAKNWYDLGILRLQLGDAAGAEADHTAAIERDPTIALAWDNRGIARQALGRFADAIADHTRALALGPDSVAAMVNRANAYLGAGNARAALVDADAALAREPERFEARVTRSQVRFSAGDLAGALEDAEFALRLQPGDPDGLLQRGLVFDHLQRLPEAEADYAAATRARPRWSRAWYNLGTARQQRRDWAGAAAAYREYLRLPATDAAEADEVRRLVAECEREASGG